MNKKIRMGNIDAYIRTLGKIRKNSYFVSMPSQFIHEMGYSDKKKPTFLVYRIGNCIIYHDISQNNVVVRKDIIVPLSYNKVEDKMCTVNSNRPCIENNCPLFSDGACIRRIELIGHTYVVIKDGIPVEIKELRR